MHPIIYKLCPPNSPVVLVHWRFLYMLLSKLTFEDQVEFKTMYIYDYNILDINMLADAHFHLDQTLKRSHLTEFWEVCDNKKLPIAIAINNCCFSKLPSSHEIDSLHKQDDRLYFSIGAHPRFANKNSTKIEDYVSTIVQNPNVVGIGEIGLDFTASSPQQQQSQISLIKILLELAVQNQQTIVVHCRDTEGQSDAFQQLLSVFKISVPKFHPIHFHCFTYSTRLMYLWIQNFPNSCFGITSIHFSSKFHESHIHFLYHVNPHQLVVESDSPYLGSSSSSVQSLVEKMAKLRSVPLSQLLTTIYFTTKKLYGIQ